MPRHVALASALAIGLATPTFADEVVVFAAASLKDALDSVATDFQAATGHTVTISYAGSNALAKQI
ncbi:MAG: molybdate ABC transporter substrate-binding protein, partial [Rhodobacterales bacterium]